MPTISTHYNSQSAIGMAWNSIYNNKSWYIYQIYYIIR
jgi:hypothetical protein